MLPSRLFYDSLFDDVNMKGMEADVYLKNGAYHVEVDVPGYDKEDIKIECHKGTINIIASHEEKNDDEEKKYIRHERKYQKLERSFYFGDIDEDSIKAEFKNGTLHLTIPQKEEESKKQISID